VEGFILGTRFWERDPAKGPSAVERISSFIEGGRAAGARHIFVAIRVEEDRSGVLDQKWPNYATVFAVCPWGSFVNPLNSLLIKAHEGLASGAYPLLASAEVAISQEAVAGLFAEMDNKTLVVGAALEGHVYEPGIHSPANGRQVPWNTLALWNPKFLWNTGFPLIGDGPIGEPKNAGVEELCTIAVIQTLYPTSKARLVQVPGQSWDTSQFDAERLAKHEKKMASKVSRPAAQLAEMGLKGPKVTHI